MKTPQHAAIYARLSLDKNEDRLGVERQIDLCSKLAADKGWTVAGTYVDNDISASTGAPRPEYDRMLIDIEAGAVDAVLVVDQDRLVRRPAELEGFIELCDRTGAALANTAGDTDLSTSDGRLKARLLGAVARAEGEKKGERMVRKFQQDAQRGVPASGPRPFGYLDDRVTVDEDEAELIRGMAARMLEGETAATVARDLNERGIPAPKSANGWTATTVAKIVRSPRVAGLRAYKGEIVGELKNADEEPVPAILDRSTWEQLNSRIRRTSRPGRPTAFLLAGGIARCAECGTTLWSSWANGKPRYVCSSRTGAGGCGKVAITAEPFEHLVVDDIIKLLASPKFKKALKAAAGDNKERRKAAAELAAAEERKSELATDYGDGTVSRRDWMTARARLDKRIDAATKILASDAGPIAGLPTTTKALTELWDTSESVDWKRAVIETVVDRIDVARATRVGARFDEGRVRDPLASLMIRSEHLFGGITIE